MFGKSGVNSPRYGKFHSEETKAQMSEAQGHSVYVYTIEITLVGTFSSRVKAANWLGVTDVTVASYIKSGKVLKNRYILRNTST